MIHNNMVQCAVQLIHLFNTCHNKIRITHRKMNTTQTFMANQKECEKIYMSLVLITKHLVLQTILIVCSRKNNKNNVNPNYAP